MEFVEKRPAPPVGAEHSMDSGEETRVSDQSGAESGALGAREASMDPGLAAVVEAWPGLSGDVRERILAIVREAGAGGP